MKFYKKTLLALAALLITVTSLCACTSPAQEADTPKSKIEKEGAFITIDINPSIELVMNEDRIVTSVGAANSDAEILLWQEDLVGTDLDTAVEKIASLALEMGYITEENSTVSVTVSTDSGKTEKVLLASINKTMEKAVEDAGLEVRVEEAVDLVLSKELERVKEQNADKEGYDDTLTLPRFRLIKSAMRADRELTMDEAVLMTNEDLTAIVNAAQEDAEAKFGEVCELARTEAAFIYENAKQTLLDSAYTAIYAARRDLSSLFGNHGVSYSGYRLAYRTIEHYSKSMRALIENPIFSSDDVFALANALGIDTSAEEEYDAFKQAITDEDGNITKDSVNAYINKQYQNMDEEDRAKLDKAYDGVMDILDRLGAEASIIREDGMTIIRGALFGLGLSVSVETYEDIPALLEAIQKKIDETYTRMEEDLTENEKAEIAEMQEEMASKIAEFEKTYREAVEKAREEAEAYLTEAKNARAK